LRQDDCQRKLLANLEVIMSLKGKTAVVTGSTSGIGHGIAMALAKDGCNIVVNGLGSEKDNEKPIAEVKKLGVRVAFDPANMLRHNQIAEMIAKAERDFGSVDILVNNAGIQHVAPVEEFPIEQWDTIIAINLTSSFHTVRATVPGMKKRKWGRIINICSAHSLRASPFKCAYVSAKHGLAGFTKTVALELAEHGVTSNAISPGFVWTPLVEKQIPDLAKSENITEDQAKRQVLSRQPTNQFVTVDQVAALAAFLASEEAASITGANYSIDGGWTAQ
jgi:3-hydroxybutyrate dehydrogenase